MQGDNRQTELCSDDFGGREKTRVDAEMPYTSINRPRVVEITDTEELHAPCVQFNHESNELETAAVEVDDWTNRKLWARVSVSGVGHISSDPEKRDGSRFFVYKLFGKACRPDDLGPQARRQVWYIDPYPEGEQKQLPFL